MAYQFGRLPGHFEQTTLKPKSGNHSNMHQSKLTSGKKL